MIEYQFHMGDGTDHIFKVEVDRNAKRDYDEAQLPDWTRLEYHQCKNCPLNTTDSTHCPVAVDLKDVVGEFSRILSIEVCEVRVITPEREYSKRCDVQTALSSLMGLVMATSGCPILGQLRRMAQSHLPFSTADETIVRTVSTYLLKQYFVHCNGGEPDLELTGLYQLYEELQVLNRCFVDRLRAAAELDASLNAVTLLSTVSFLVTFSLKDKLEEIKGLYLAQ